MLKKAKKFFASNTNENLFTTIYFYVSNFYANVLVNKCVYISDEDDLAYFLPLVVQRFCHCNDISSF